MATTLNTKRMDLPIVCDLSVFNTEERKKHLDESTELFSNAKRVLEIEDGFAFHFDYSQELFLTLANWIKNDNRCCPFLTHEVAIEPFASGRETIVRLRVQMK
ncbi:MAG: hypothetical protein ACOYXT_20780 [Bacteroidota bacterium]